MRIQLLKLALKEREFILCIDETGDRKKGKTTDYVARQYIGNLGKTENGIFYLLYDFFICLHLQPIELCWLRWCDVNFAEKTLMAARNRSLSTRDTTQQLLVNRQPLCPPEIELLEQLYQQRTTDWVFASERKQRLSERSLHHIIQQAGAIASLPLTVHPYMLRRSGLFYRAALLLQPSGLTLRQCCLLWNCHASNSRLSAQDEQDDYAITYFQKEAFFKALEQMKTFSGITLDENVIDYVLGAFLLFPGLKEIPHDYWLNPSAWHLQTLPKKPGAAESNHRHYHPFKINSKRSRDPTGSKPAPP